MYSHFTEGDTDKRNNKDSRGAIFSHDNMDDRITIERDSSKNTPHKLVDNVASFYKTLHMLDPAAMSNVSLVFYILPKNNV